EGCDLARLLYERRAPLPVGEAVEYVVQALDAVAEAHARGVVHRDLKPSNLFLTQHPGSPPVIKVLDFGISKVDDAFGTGGSANPSITSSRAIIGSPTYMSPEQIQNIRKTDHRADIWSVGVILYELMSGTLPFRGETPGEIFVRIIEGHVTPLCKLRKEVPVALSGIVEKCLRRSLHERFENVVELAEALAPFAWYKHHEALARMRRTVAVRAARSVPPGTSSHSVPAAVRQDTGSRTTGQTGTPAGTKVLLGIAAAVPLLILPIAAVLVVHRSGSTATQPPAATMTIAPASAQTTEPVATAVTTLAPPPTTAEPPAAATLSAPSASEPPSASAAPPEVVSVATPTETAPIATAPAAHPTHAPPPSKRSILQQRY
ncbi:MAG TPA: protein kinase, partial [Polyangiaceae bacterium]